MDMICKKKKKKKKKKKGNKVILPRQKVFISSGKVLEKCKCSELFVSNTTFTKNNGTKDTGST